MARTLIFKIVASVIFLLSHAVYAAEMKMHHDTVIVDASKDRGSGICILGDKLCLTTFAFKNQDIIKHTPVLESCDTYKVELVATNYNTTLAAVIVSGFVKNTFQKRHLVSYKATGAFAVNEKFDLNADKDTQYHFGQCIPNDIILYKVLHVDYDEIEFTTSESTINIKSKKEPRFIQLAIIKFSS